MKACENGGGWEVVDKIILLKPRALLRQAEFDKRNTTRCTSQDEDIILESRKEAGGGFLYLESPSALLKLFCLQTRTLLQGSLA